MAALFVVTVTIKEAKAVPGGFLLEKDMEGHLVTPIEAPAYV